MSQSSSEQNPNRALTCSVCGYKNRVGALVCENCGTQLFSSGASVVDTRPFTQPPTAAQSVGSRLAQSDEPTTEPRPGDGRAETSIEAGKTASFTPEGLSRKCPNCGHVNRPGLIVCDNCGTNLLTGEQPKIATEKFDTTGASVSEVDTADAPPESRLSTDEVRAVMTAGAAVFEDDMVLRMEIEGAPTPILVYPSAETVVGRRDPITGTAPNVDLTPYAGYRMGVSRQHAVLRLQNRVLDIRDLGSSNGTFVNGARLNPHQPHSLRDGDEVMFGKMVVKMFFQATMRRGQ